MNRNPIAWIRLRLTPSDDKHRSLYCKFRDRCLDDAIAKRWTGMSCIACDLRDREEFHERPGKPRRLTPGQRKTYRRREHNERY